MNSGICALTMLFFLRYCQCNNTVVYTNSGYMRGTRLTVLGKEIDAYLGVPYAVPPIGELRFRKPRPISSWQGIYNAAHKSCSCPQFIFDPGMEWAPAGNISEDCLYLNLWVPRFPKTGKAIIVWIHGGGFFQGSSVIDAYDGQILASRGDVIVASMNYRLGALGFLSLGTEEAPGNVGLYDQLLAVRWIKDNAKSLGGDPSLITVSGQSAGGMSAGYLLLSPLSRGLSYRAIMQSGNPHNNLFARSLTIIKLATAILSERLGCPSNLRKPKEVLRCLRRKTAVEIYSEEIKLQREIFIVFLPRYGEDFLPYHPISMLNTGNFQPADLLIGTTADEGSLLVAWRNVSLLSIDRPITTKDRAAYYIMDFLRYDFAISLDAALEKYLGSIPDNDSESLLKAAYKAIGSELLVCPSVFISEIYSRTSNVYFYHFTHRSSQPWRAFREWMGVPHLQEIPFVFGDPLKKDSKYNTEEIEFSRNIIEAWSSFAKYGFPIYAPLPRWPRFSIRESRYVELNPYRVTIGSNLRKDECDFWRTFNTIYNSGPRI